MSNELQPPPDRHYLMLLVLLVFGISIILLVWGVKMCKVEVDKVDLSSTDYYLEAQNPYEIHLSIIRASIPAQAPPYLIKGQVYGILIDEELYNIFECENPAFDPELCNQEYGCGSGIGLGQLTAIAIKDCEKNLGKKIDPRDPYENIECSIWLYETYGTKPWGTKDTWWGSYHCWNK